MAKSKGGKSSAGRGGGKSGGRGQTGRKVKRAPDGGPSKSAIARVFSGLLLVPVLGALGYGMIAGGGVGRVADGLAVRGDRLLVSAGFGIRDVTISGRAAAAERDILNAVGAMRGTSLFAFDCQAARARLVAMDRIADAEVRRLWPGTVHVDLVERKPLAVWQHDGKLTLVDAAGHAIADVAREDLDKYPHVVGIGAQMHAAALIDVLARFPKIESRVRAAVRVGDRRWNLELSNGMEVWLPAEGIETALSELLRLDQEQGVLAREIQAIDMRFKDRWILRLPVGSTEIQTGPSRNT